MTSPVPQKTEKKQVQWKWQLELLIHCASDLGGEDGFVDRRKQVRVQLISIRNGQAGGKKGRQMSSSGCPPLS
jgi:hypothetical protein